jgi:glycosyltransferase involved in cell wall biosynthesis
MEPQLSIVIGTYNQREVLKKILESFNTQTAEKGSFELIVVDSSSSDGTRNMLETFEATYPFRFIIQENNGKAAARNRGVAAAIAPTIMITDADMIAHPDLVKTHIQAHQNARKPSCFEGVTMNMFRLEWPTTPRNLYPYISKKISDGSSLGWYYFLTGNISFPKAVFDSENGFDESFMSYGWEDLELGYRLSRKKVPLYFLKSAINYHYHVVTKDEEISRNVKKGESARLFLKKHRELKWFLGLNPMSVFIFKRLAEEGVVHRWMRDKFYHSPIAWRQQFGFWFLREFYYLKGILKEG